MDKIQAIRGMNDILPEESYQWEWIESRIRKWLAMFGYQNIRTPILERTDLFVRSIGTATDIVEKEMYTFMDTLNGDSLTLRPEGTASAVRAAIQHNMTYGDARRLYYYGPMFRHERPQKGRFRQFHQVGVEALGFEGPDIDAEHVLMASELWRSLGIAIGEVRLEINSLGSKEDRGKYRESLVTFLKVNETLLDEDSRRRININPLRVLDSKNPEMQKLVSSAPKLLEYLSTESIDKMERFKLFLENAGIEYLVNPNLVRGLDYYNDVVYEWKTDFLGAQGTICAGGRYDILAEQIGGKPIPACGFALGVERVLATLESCSVLIPKITPDVYVVSADEKAQLYAWDVCRELRDNGLKVILHCGGGALKSQMKKADMSGANFAIIIGNSEMARKRISLKSLRGAKMAMADQQQDLSVTDAISRIRGSDV
ncbi:MAG: histidine--tRNA ligase [Proteobacteria bacterium]|nr:histidine--tRNA ligase [Pseudomonadota bacterium]MDA1331883.1 histidine--tRNA ligase [Pseudomonadota bacterium]